MGNEGSKQEIQTRIDQQREQERTYFDQQMQILKQLDTRTKVPHLLIELRNLGYVEICGKDLGGIYGKLDQFLTQSFKAGESQQVLLPYGDENGCGCGQTSHRMAPREPFDDVADKRYVLGQEMGNGRVQGNGIYQSRGEEGENNMGKLTMHVVDFMTNQCGWGLQLSDGGNLGRYGQMRESQIKFKAPHPLNLMAPHIMIELRQVGYVEVNGKNNEQIYEKLAGFVQSKWGGSQIQADPIYCDLKFRTSAFKSRGTEGENNMGLKTMELVDFMTQKCSWTLLTCTGGNYGRRGDKREQQLIFRNDEFVQHGEHHMMIEFRDQGYIELNGLHDVPEAAAAVDGWYKQMGCRDYQAGFWESSELYCDKKLSTSGGFYFRQGTTNNLGKRTIELATFLASQGWMLLLANGGNVSADHEGFHIRREQQVKFTRARPTDDPSHPLLMIELRTIPTNHTPAQYNGFIEINGPNTNQIYEKIVGYMQQTMRARQVGRTSYCDLLLSTDIFRLRESTGDHYEYRYNGRLNGESNFGRYTMRLCDFMVDHLGEWDLVVCNGNSIDTVFRVGKDDTISVTGREQQLIFRHRPGGRAVFMADSAQVAALGRAPLQPPKYWSEGTKDGSVGHFLAPATPAEKAMIQKALDGTYKKKTTRDGKERVLADRFVVVSALRSEHPALWDKYANRRREVLNKTRERRHNDFQEPKTSEFCPELKERCTSKSVGNPTNEAYLFHGSNPTSAISILGTSFKIDLAGASVGTMFGPGVYLAESSTKSDEYARDENTGGAYDGLFAVLLCRTVMGSSYVIEKPGNYADKCTSGDFDTVIGDREKAVGTFREVIVFDEGSIYPEYVAFYRREFNSTTAPAPAQASMADPAADRETPAEGVSIAPPGGRECQIQIPAGAPPGSTIECKAPWGDTLQVKVPEGTKPGDVITVKA